ncbi:MAG: proline--tRNA ligase [Candidatus Kerfeldbacteria bacterium CG15_BIG_FIL_POST_REV_8_21_14_020_45_12]|uniref:Proline--tRNA ligase n=1 Tax=Candidatus Kerfeldbacteria bacterium CG15_BIG_FIL_POST_REV_8_21_14_020_45_12 TaxID=2014247 RepID=A0A2M7H356_9BACT|nr:MAG: proline--tRNA ligase [Candidatus Kerfeldbacteria bacterium CG15_BIG_FIL_POST_REV_8_21_14_020_45_12]PJA93300.1 MAG: proline--tRNA ligase [Candidatus Kerfeldbacteria bacterium CG_4_9_14_3_um_filter_45_8]
MSNNKNPHKDKAITTRDEDYSQWYLDVIRAADMAENSPVRGAMIIKPYGFSIWERIQRILDDKIKETGHQNAYFPLLIPKSFLSREADHVEGFAKECAVVTHHRLKASPEGGVIVDPDAKLEEEYVIRPTSETIIHDSFSRWISSYRDLPMLINQWANVMRWEMRTRIFLRTSEFLWQEGHTAHATQDEAAEETAKMLEVYRVFAEEVMAMPVIAGEKSPSERFAGANKTFTIEAMMQDGKALQSGTSHELGQGFSKAFNITFLDQESKEQYAWLTSWGVSTRLMGALIMSHSDDRGLIVPPALAPTQVVIIPIIKEGKDNSEVFTHVDLIKSECAQNGIRVHIDDRDHFTFGEKSYEWEKKGVPVRIEIGPRDLENHSVTLVSRTADDKQQVSIDSIADSISQALVDIQATLYNNAQERLTSRTFVLENYNEFKEKIEAGGFFSLSWCGEAKCEDQIKDETKATIRCIPFEQNTPATNCILCDQPAKQRAIFARAY